MIRRIEKALPQLIVTAIICTILLLVAVDILEAAGSGLLELLFGDDDFAAPIIGDGNAVPDGSPDGCVQLPDGLIVCEDEGGEG
ncbi:MAG: hypothetical protein RIC85_05795 [Gammaproteobacteria bacterium]